MTRETVGAWVFGFLVLAGVVTFCTWYSHQSDAMVCQRYGDCPSGK